MEKILAQSQALEDSRNQLSQQYVDNFDVEKQIYQAKKQALQSAKGLGAQLLGSEQLQAAEIGIPLAYKTFKTARDIYRNPEAFKNSIRSYTKNLIKQKTGVDVDELPQNLDEAKTAIRSRLETEARARGIPTSQAELKQNLIKKK